MWRRKIFQKGNSAAGISPSACSLAEPLYTTPMVLNDFIKRKVMWAEWEFFSYVKSRKSKNKAKFLARARTSMPRHKVVLPVMLGRILEKESITSSLKKLNLHATFHLYTKTNNILVQNCRRIAIVQYNTDKLIWLWRERKKQKIKQNLYSSLYAVLYVGTNSSTNPCHYPSC